MQQFVTRVEPDERVGRDWLCQAQPVFFRDGGGLLRQHN